MIEIVNRSRESECVCNPLRTIPAPDTLDKEWRELRQDHSWPVIAITSGIIVKLLDGCQLLITDRYTNDVVVLFRFVEDFPAYAGLSERGYAYASIVRHDQFCVRVFALGCPADDPVVPASLTLVEGYTKLKWFCRLSYPIV